MCWWRIKLSWRPSLCPRTSYSFARFIHIYIARSCINIYEFVIIFLLKRDNRVSSRRIGCKEKKRKKEKKIYDTKYSRASFSAKYRRS